MKLEEVLSEFRTYPELFKFTRKSFEDNLWYRIVNNRFFCYNKHDVPIMSTIRLPDLLAEDWVIDYNDDSNAKKR